MDCALSGEADEFLSGDNPQNFGGAQAEVWHGPDGHPLFEGNPRDGTVGLVCCGSWSF